MRARSPHEPQAKPQIVNERSRQRGFKRRYGESYGVQF
jgi:hypothetical protein